MPRENDEACADRCRHSGLREAAFSPASSTSRLAGVSSSRGSPWAPPLHAPPESTIVRSAFAHQPLDLRAQRRRDVGAVERIGDVGGEEADLRAAVEALGPRTSVRRTAASSASAIIASVSWISPPAPRLLRRQDVEDLRLQDVAAGDDEVRRRLLARRLLHHLGDREHLALGLADADHAVACGCAPSALPRPR